MIRALQELGKYLIEEEGRGGLTDYLSLGKIESADTLLAIQFARKNGAYVYDGVAVYDLEGHRKDILYLKDWHNTHDETPTSKIHRIDSLDEKKNRESAVRNDAIDWIFEGWYEEAAEATDNRLITDLLSEYADKEEQIRAETIEAWETTENPDECVLTVQYESEDGEMQFIGDIPFFESVVRDSVADNWRESSTYGMSAGTEEACSICGEVEEEVYGFAFPLPIYTVDNARYAPDFDRNRSWENLPVCGDCAIQLRVAINFIEDQSFTFYLGDPINYYVIPNFPLEGPVNDNLMEAIVRGSADDEYTFLQAERIYESYENPSYPLTLDIVFYTTSQSQQQIERYIRDVEPPWMRTASQTLRNTYADLNELGEVDFGVDDPEQLKRLDRLIYRTLPGNHDDSFADTEAFQHEAFMLVEGILKRDKINIDQLMALFDDEIRARFHNNEDYREYVLRTFLLVNFLHRLNILKREATAVKSYENIKRDWGDNTPEALDRFFEDFSESFDHPAKRAVFIEGVLAQHLIDVQSRVREGDPPLRKQLSGLRLTTDRVRELLPRLFQDIDAYDRKSDFPVKYRNLREAAATSFTEADNAGWTVSDEEVRYYFMLGMSLNRIFKSDHENETELPAHLEGNQ